MMSTSSSLPTAPIGKQQVIDMKAGAILRENARRDGLFFGCPLGVVLVLIVLTKCLFISYWIIREYETFDFRCSAWNGAPMEAYRMKRWAQLENSDPRKFSKNPDDDDEDEDEDSVYTVIKELKKKKPLYGASRRAANSDFSSESPKIDPRLDFGPLPPTFQRKIDSNQIPDIDRKNTDDDDDLPMTTMVTLTNTQIVPLSGEEHGVVKMKTIRNRVEKIGSDEEQFIEIDIANAPRIYVSKIKSRQGGEEEEPFDLLKELKKDEKKPKKKKGKGLKKAKKLAMEAAKSQNSTEHIEASTPTTPKPTKKPKKTGKKSKTSKSADDVTKQPRHLVGKSTVIPTSPGPPKDHPSSWINGILDPKDPNFTNQGQIRGYTMQKASRKPQTTTSSPSGASGSESADPRVPLTSSASDSDEDNLKISDSTRMMWDMDELKYTTFMAPKTTEQTRPEAAVPDQEQHKVEKVEEHPMLKQMVVETTTEKPMVAGMSKSEYEQKKEAFEAYTPSISKQDLSPHSIRDPFHVHLPYPTSTASPVMDYPLYPPSEAPYFVEVNEADTETIYVKDVTPMFRNLLMEPARRQEEMTTKPYDPLHLQMEIAKLKESSTCLARMAFDVWCLFVLFSSVPFIMGICVPRWSLFVLHIVFDFLFLVVGFVTSLTIAIMSTIMFFLIEEMKQDSLFEFLSVAFVIDIVLIVYSIIVGIAYRCCCRLVDNSIKEQSINYSVSSNGEAV